MATGTVMVCHFLPKKNHTFTLTTCSPDSIDRTEKRRWHLLIYIQVSGLTSVKTWHVLFWSCLWVLQRHKWRRRRPDWWIYLLICHQELGEGGKSAFYQGRIAQAIVDVIKENGGVVTLEDLGSHDSEVMSPVSTAYKVRSATQGADCICCLGTNLAKGTYCVCPGGAAVGASSKQPGIGCPAAAQHPGELPSQRYCGSLTGKPSVPECWKRLCMWCVVNLLEIESETHFFMRLVKRNCIILWHVSCTLHFFTFSASKLLRRFHRWGSKGSFI